MVGTVSELMDLNSAPEEQQDSVWMNMESSMILADEGTSSQDNALSTSPSFCVRTKTFDEVFSDMINYCDSNDQGQTKNPPASPKAFENLARAGVFKDDVHEPPPQQTRYKKGIKERRRLKNRELAAKNLLAEIEEELARAKAAMQAKANEKPTAMRRRVFSSPR